MTKHKTLSAKGMAYSRYTREIENDGPYRIFAHTHPRIAGNYVVVWNETDWEAFETLGDVQNAISGLR